MASRPRSRTVATPDLSKRRSLPAGYDGGRPAVDGVTTSPAAAYISTRISPPDSPLPQYDAFKEQRLYNFVMSPSNSQTTVTPTRHARNSSVGSSTDGNFFTSLFAPNLPSPPHSRSQSISGPQPPSASRRLSVFFGLGASNDGGSTSGLAFTASSASSKRSVSNSTTMSNLVMPGGAGDGLHNPNQNPMTRDEFAGVDFAELLQNGVPKSPLNCTPQGFSALQEKSVELIEMLYAGYMERTRALAAALADIEALRDEREQKDQKIESLRFSVEQLANVQETISKAAEEAERAAEKSNAEVKKLRAENAKLQWESKSVRDVEMEDADSMASRYGAHGKSRELTAPQSMRPRTKSSNSDSGFESESDSASVFSHDSTMKSTDTSSTSPMYPPSIAIADEDRYEVDAAAAPSPGPLAQLRKVLRRSTTLTDVRCDCSATINRLRGENGHLMTRVKELEGCLDGCLDLVAGV